MSHFNPKHLLDRGPERFAPVDGLRAISVLWMIAFHAIYFVGWFVGREPFAGLLSHNALRPLENGHLGVDIFFVISGYLIASLLLKELDRTGKIRLKAFYTRRAFRVLPAYVIGLLLTALILKERSNIQYAWTNLLFINNFFPTDKQAMGWSWSLAIEEQFYLIFPVALIALHSCARRQLKLFAWLLGLAFVIRIALVWILKIDYPVPIHPVFDHDGFYRYFSGIYDKTYGRFGGILFGVLVAYLERDTAVLKSIASRPGLARACLLTCGGVIGFFLMRAGYATPEDAWPRGALMVYFALYRYLFAACVAYGLLYVIAQARFGKPGLFNRVLSWRGWLPAAELSYGAYLLHPLVIIAVYFKHPPQLFTFGEMAGKFVTIFIVTFTLAYLMYAAVERPLREKGRILAKGA